jgi:hypothetical protein
MGPMQPEQLHSDQGRNFEAEVVQEICKLLEIVKTRTSPDGLVERMNRTLLDMPTILLGQSPNI